MSLDNSNVQDDLICKHVSVVSDGEHTHNICTLASSEHPPKCDGSEEDMEYCQYWRQIYAYERIAHALELIVESEIESEMVAVASEKGYI